MVRATLKEATALQRKARVPDSDRTPDRDKVADWIEANVIHGDWDWSDTTISEIAEEIDYSRQHVATTLDYYFDPLTAGRDDPVSRLIESIPRVDGSDDFRDGFREGWAAGVGWGLRHHDEIMELRELENDHPEFVEQ